MAVPYGFKTTRRFPAMKKYDRWQKRQCQVHERPRGKNGDKRWSLLYRREKAKRPGHYGKQGQWDFRRKLGSRLPPWISEYTFAHLKAKLKPVAKNLKTFKTLEPLIIEALLEAGRVEFEARVTSRETVLWTCHGEPFVEFLVADMYGAIPAGTLDNKKIAQKLRDETESKKWGHLFRQLERKSKAPLRLAYVVCQGGWCRLAPGKLRKK
jgi:hypothetical protein